MTLKSTYLLFCLFLLALVSCGDDDDPVIENPEELITDLTYTLIPQGGGTTVTLSFQDADGDGGQAPTITVSGDLAMNTVYDGTISLLNASDPTDVEDITDEVREEDDEHQFFYTPGNGLNVDLAYADSDDNGQPVGITTNLTTTSFSSGNLTILLRHEPMKDSPGLSITDPSGAGGETDIQVTFPLAVTN